MARIMAIDYGKKRVGLAVTDPLQMIASGLTTVRAHDVINFLKSYTEKEEIECFIVGLPKQMNNEPSESEAFIVPFLNRLRKVFPHIEVKRMDERFTSKMAFQTMIDGGLKKMDRRNKELVDQISATIILQSYMEQKSML